METKVGSRLLCVRGKFVPREGAVCGIERFVQHSFCESPPALQLSGVIHLLHLKKIIKLPTLRH